MGWLKNVKKSFTLMELAVVLAILVILMILAFPTLPVLKTEKIKDDARKTVNLFKNVLERVVFKGELLKLSILEDEIKVFDCQGTLIQKDENEENFSDFKIKVVEVCEWKEVAKVKLSGKVKEIWVDGKELIPGEETDIILSTYIPFVEVLITDKNEEKGLWVSFNPYTFSVAVSEKSSRVEL